MKKLLVALILLSGCATVNEPVKMQVAFNHAEHEMFKRSGSHTVKGQAFLRQRNGGVVTCAGNAVLMFPDTPFFREFIKIVDSGKKPEITKTELIPENWRSIIKNSQCDAQGNFSFTNIPTGQWIVVTTVVWQIPGRYTAYDQGGSVIKYFMVNGDTQILLSDQDR